MTRLSLLALALVIAGCMQSHDNQVVEIRGSACVTCHTPDYEATAAPAHATSMYPTTCVDCHRTTSWQPALGLHPVVVDPVQDFTIQTGPHATIACLDCHVLPLDGPAMSTDGENTNCVQCHPDSASMRSSHTNAMNPLPGGAPVTYAAIAYSTPRFCLTCHPAGLANKHPTDKFPFNNHHSKNDCVKCHDQTMPPNGLANSTCLVSGCHSLSKADGDHREVGKYNQERGDGSNRHFCANDSCHPTGRR